MNWIMWCHVVVDVVDVVVGAFLDYFFHLVVRLSLLLLLLLLLMMTTLMVVWIRWIWWEW